MAKVSQKITQVLFRSFVGSLLDKSAIIPSSFFLRKSLPLAGLPRLGGGEAGGARGSEFSRHRGINSAPPLGPS